jgi:hypothetical protein
MARSTRSLRREADQLRAHGTTVQEIVARWRQQHELNSRVAYRLANGLTQGEVAELWNSQWPDAQAPKTGKQISYWESWPGPGGRAPSAETLNRLAFLYRCAAGELLDGEDHSPTPTSPGLPAEPIAGIGADHLIGASDPAVELRRGLFHRKRLSGHHDISLSQLQDAVRRAAFAYQSARYSALDELPSLAGRAEELVVELAADDQRRAYELLAWANLIASKLAAKLGDGPLALLTADRARSCLRHLDNPALAGVADYQTSCALARTAGHNGDAEDVAIAAAARLDGAGGPEATSVSGALLLQAAICAAQRGDGAAARHLLSRAADLAESLGYDGNEHWTAFGPTNVQLHRLAVAVALGQTTEALELGERIDTSRMPPSLRSRRAQVHLDVAVAHCRNPKGYPSAVLHLLEAERIAPQVISHNTDARATVLMLMSRERRSTMPGLRPLAHRAGLLR